MPTEQNTTKKDSACAVVLNWVLNNVVYGCIPLASACIFKCLGGASIDLLKLTPDCLLVGFAISISAKAYIEERNEAEVSQKKKSNWGSIPFITCAICCILYAGLFGEFSAFDKLGEAESLKFVIVGLAFAILINIGVIWHLQAIHDKNEGN